MKKIVIKSFKNMKDESPNIIDIDAETGKVRQISNDHDSVNFKNVSQKALNNFITTFLPNGFPNTVGDQYLKFTALVALEITAFTTMTFISTQSLLVALGASTGQAGIAASAYLWVLKDGIGQMGGILFASKYGQNFDSDIKKWRFMSLFCFNMALWVDITTLAYP